MNQTSSSSSEQQVTIEHEHKPDTTKTTTNPYYNSRNRCCFTFPCLPKPNPHLTLGGSGSGSGSSLWSRIRVGESESKWWATPIKALKKIREWSEIVAGPKWKTFIRRFNRKSRHGHGHGSPGKFQYDPLSYALNFDEGQNGQYDEEGFVENYPDFSSRFAVLPSSAKTSMDLGKVSPIVSS